MQIIRAIKHKKYNCEQVVEIFSSDFCRRVKWSDEDNYIPAPGESAYVLSDDTPVDVGWRVRDGIPIPDEEVVLEDIKADKRVELKAARDAVIEEGFAYKGYVYPLDTDIQQTLTMQFIGSQLMPAPHYSWKDKSGIYRDIGDAAAFQAFATVAMMYGQSVYAREEMLQAYVNGLDDVDKMLSVTWETIPDGPPV